jgi:hypothetical protein
LELNVIPTVGEVPLQQLNAAHLNRLYAYLLTDGRKDGNGGLSTRSVRYVHTILQRALSDAMRWGLVERNVAALADPPRVTTAATQHIRTWTRDELRRSWTTSATTGCSPPGCSTPPPACAAARSWVCAGSMSTCRRSGWRCARP